MSERRLQPVTRIRGELQPAPAVVRAVNRFLENPMDERAVRMFTATQVIMPLGEARRSRAAEIATIERAQRKRSLAQRAFTLAHMFDPQDRPDGSGRLFFSVSPKDQPAIGEFGEELRTIEGLEAPVESNLLYVEIARGGLSRDVARRRDMLTEGQGLLRSELRHPSAPYRMTATGLHIVTKDMVYPVAQPEPENLPLAE